MASNSYLSESFPIESSVARETTLVIEYCGAVPVLLDSPLTTGFAILHLFLDGLETCLWL